MALFFKSDSSMRLTELGGRHMLDGISKDGLKALYDKKIEGSGGDITNQGFYDSVTKFISDNDLAGRIHTFVSSELGVVTSPTEDGNGLAMTGVTRLVNLGQSPDFVANVYLKVSHSEAQTNMDGVGYTSSMQLLGSLENPDTPNVNMPTKLDGYVDLNKQTSSFANHRLGFKQEKPYPLSATGNVAVFLVAELAGTGNTSRVFPVNALTKYNNPLNGGSAMYPLRLATPKNGGPAGIRVERYSEGQSVSVLFNTEAQGGGMAISFSRALGGLVNTVDGELLIRGVFRANGLIINNSISAPLEPHRDTLREAVQLSIGSFEGISTDTDVVIRFKHLVVLQDCSKSEFLAFSEFLEGNL